MHLKLMIMLILCWFAVCNSSPPFFTIDAVDQSCCSSSKTGKLLNSLLFSLSMIFTLLKINLIHASLYPFFGLSFALHVLEDFIVPLRCILSLTFQCDSAVQLRSSGSGNINQTIFLSHLKAA